MVTQDPEPENDPSVLAEAAVAAAAVSGAAAAKADEASSDAEQAEATAGQAAILAAAAASEAASKPSHDDVAAIVDERLSAFETNFKATLEEVLTSHAETTEPQGEPVKDTLPPSVEPEVKKKKRSFADRFYGRDGDDE